MNIKRRIIAMPKFNDRRIYVNRNIPDDLFYINACGISYPDKNYYIERHYPKHYTVQYIMSGKGFICYEKQKYALKAGDIFWICNCDGISYGADPEDPFFKLSFTGLGKFWDYTTKIFGLDEPFGIVHADDGIMEYFNRVFDVAPQAETKREMGMCAITELFSRIYDIRNENSTQNTAETADGKKVTEADLISEIKRYVDMHICDEDTLSRIAGHFGISERTVYTKFKNSYGMTPAEYVKSHRLSQGEKMLCGSKSSISEIAESLGFSGTSYFCKVFKEKYGLTPQQYRNNLKNNTV